MAKKQGKTPTKISELIPDPKNFNKHTPYGMGLLEKSIRKFGFMEAGVISEDNVIASGNARQETAVNIGMDEVQIIDIDGTKPVYLRKKGLKSGTPEFHELALALNQVGQANVVMDCELIEATVGEAVCEEWGIELPENEVTDDGFDAEPPLNPITVLGDVYELNQHRVMCGDSTEAGKDLKSFLLALFKSYSDNIKSGAVLYVCHAESLGMDVIFRSAFAESGFKPAEIIIWVKDQFAFGRQDYHWRHEPIIYGWKEGGAHKFLGERNQNTVWEFPRPKVSKEHPTMKPVALIAKGVANSSKSDDIVMDLCLGSGTTLIASEELGRICYGAELAPNYTDVIIARFIKYKLSSATERSFTIKRNGKELSEKEIAKYLKQIEPRETK